MEENYPKVTWTEVCPVCGAAMAKGNKVCSMGCYEFGDVVNK